MRIEPTESDVAWAAGLFEGEGCFNAYRRQSKWGVQVRLAMADRDVVERFAQIVGVGGVHPVSRAKQEHWKPLFEWYIQSGPGVIRVIDMLSPWFGTRRSERAREVRAVATTIQPQGSLRTHCPKGHPYQGDNLVLEDGRRRCKTCRNEQSRNRARARLGITPDRYRI